jgi:hypothetical protein
MCENQHFENRLNLFFNFFETLANSLTDDFVKNIKAILKTKLETRFDIGTIPYFFREK